MKKSKAKDVDLFYLNKEKPKKKSKKNNSKTKKKNVEVKTKDAVFSFDDEIVIGVTKKPDEPKQKKKNGGVSSKNTKSKISKKKKQNKKISEKEKAKKAKYKGLSAKQIQKLENRKKIIKGILKWGVLLTIFIGATIYFFLSPIFNIKNIVIEQNEKITKEQIISLSGVNIDENLFKININEIINNIKESAYIESVEVHRVLPSDLRIVVKERVPTFMVEFLDSFVYLNNQGYILEISEEKLPVPIIMGYETLIEEIQEGNRLINKDLYKLETVLRIMEAARSHEVSEMITKIDISNKNNFTLVLEEEQKVVYFGDASNANTRILYMKEIVEREKGQRSELFINGNLNTQQVYSREMLD